MKIETIIDAKSIGAESSHRNLSVSELIEHAIRRGEGALTATGALAVSTGAFTGRSPKDKYIVADEEATRLVDWGPVNRPLAPELFDRLHRKVALYLQNKNTYSFDGFAGADPACRMRIRVVTEYAWHNLFMRQLLIRPTEAEGTAGEPDFTIVSAPGFSADPSVDGTRSGTFIAVSFAKKIVLIGGTEYAGEMKKAVFTLMNYLLPQRGMLPMHCSANVGPDGDVAVFFGLSGTGKTTLSADPARRLIGDDEHVWTDDGVSNIEGGCYAKCIGLTEAKEPQIWNAIRYGAVLENVRIASGARLPDYCDASRTENTRAAYPVEHMPNAVSEGRAGHPRTIVFLTADAFGVLPPVAKLTEEQAIYHFLSGYTSKLAGTERGVTEPEATFSACFGAPFLPLPPKAYAEQLREKIRRHRPNLYLINTGWIGGPYGTGERIPLGYTRAIVAAALNGALEAAPCVEEAAFGLSCPTVVPGVPSDMLLPRNTWDDKAAYDRAAAELAERFEANYRSASKDGAGN